MRSKFATLGKYCVCGHGIGSHRNSAGAKATFCRLCDCSEYQRDLSNKNDWAKRDRVTEAEAALETAEKNQ